MAAKWLGLDKVGSGEVEQEDAIEDGEVQPCSGAARATQGFSRSLIVCTFDLSSIV